jgi:hypothetical protein
MYYCMRSVQRFAQVFALACAVASCDLYIAKDTAESQLERTISASSAEQGLKRLRDLYASEHFERADFDYLLKVWKGDARAPAWLAGSGESATAARIASAYQLALAHRNRQFTLSTDDVIQMREFAQGQIEVNRSNASLHADSIRMLGAMGDPADLARFATEANSASSLVVMQTAIIEVAVSCDPAATAILEKLLEDLRHRLPPNFAEEQRLMRSRMLNGFCRQR